MNSPRPETTRSRYTPGWIREFGVKWRAFRRVVGRFTPYLQGHKTRLVLAVTYGLAYVLMRILEPWPLKLIIDNVLLDQPLPWFLPSVLEATGEYPYALLYSLVVALLLFAVAQGLFYYYQRIVVSRLGIAITSAMRIDLYRHVQNLSLRFHDRRQTGDLIIRITSDIRQIRQAFLSLPFQLLEGVLLMVGMAIVMLVMDWQLALIALLLFPILALLVRKYNRPLRKAVRKQRKREGHLATLASEALGAIKVVQGLHRQGAEVERFGGASKRDMRSGAKAARFEAKLRWASQVSVAVITALIVALASQRIIKGSLTPGDLIVFVAYLRVFSRPIRGISRAALRLARATSAGERLLQIMDIQPEVQNIAGATRAPAFSGAIQFEDVSLYHGGTQILHSINLRIEPGQHVAIVGPVGAGKSTLVSLLPRLYDPDQGIVKIDGTDIHGFDLGSLRDQISIVFQEPILFATTVSENIIYGKPGATEEEVRFAAEQAGIDAVIRDLPDGYQTSIGERGGTLSGGQRQCVSIARAIIRDAPIVILDEPTANLDKESASLVMDAILTLTRNRTAILITHQLHMVQSVDRVVSMNAGRVIENVAYRDFAAQSEIQGPLKTASS